MPPSSSLRENAALDPLEKTRPVMAAMPDLLSGASMLTSSLPLQIPGTGPSLCDPREVRCSALTLGETCTYLGASWSLFSSRSRLPLLRDKIGVKWG